MSLSDPRGARDLTDLVRARATSEGRTACALPGLWFFRWDCPQPMAPGRSSTLHLAVAVQGRKARADRRAGPPLRPSPLPRDAGGDRVRGRPDRRLSRGALSGGRPPPPSTVVQALLDLADEASLFGAARRLRDPARRCDGGRALPPDPHGRRSAGATRARPAGPLRDRVSPAANPLRRAVETGRIQKRHRPDPPRDRVHRGERRAPPHRRRDRPSRRDEPLPLRAPLPRRRQRLAHAVPEARADGPRPRAPSSPRRAAWATSRHGSATRARRTSPATSSGISASPRKTTSEPSAAAWSTRPRTTKAGRMPPRSERLRAARGGSQDRARQSQARISRVPRRELSSAHHTGEPASTSGRALRRRPFDEAA